MAKNKYEHKYRRRIRRFNERNHTIPMNAPEELPSVVLKTGHEWYNALLPHEDIHAIRKFLQFPLDRKDSRKEAYLQRMIKYFTPDPCAGWNEAK